MHLIQLQNTVEFVLKTHLKSVDTKYRDKSTNNPDNLLTSKTWVCLGSTDLSLSDPIKKK